ncbi:UDP-3-O-(3-hydroxymyristoyl)glucosamine N-acyltransferase [Maricaulaceae bacterium MS644]
MGADARFFERLGPLSAGDLAALCGAELTGDAALAVHDVNTPGQAGAGELFFLARNADTSIQTPGACAIVADAATAEQLSSAGAVLIAHDPRAAFGRACAALLRARDHVGDTFIDPSAVIHASARLAPGVVIGPDAEIGEAVEIGPGAVVGPGVVIGARSRIGPRAVVQCAVLGERVEILTGAVIGEAGFGLALDQGGLLSIPHVGRVIIENEVVIGANSTVDRGMIRDTILRKACKIDNLCHIAHNCEIGEYAVMAAFSGVSGSVHVGRGAQFGGRAGVADHLRIGDGARLAAFAGVMKDVPDGETWAGSPAQPIQRFMREIVWIRRQSGVKKNAKPKKDEQ